MNPAPARAPRPPAGFSCASPFRRALDQVIAKCLQVEVEKRYQDAGELAAALDAIAAHGPSASKRRAPFLLPAAAVLVAGLLFAAYFLWIERNARGQAESMPLSPPETQRTAATEPLRIAVLPFENLGRPEDTYFAEGITEEITSRLAAIPQLGVISRTSASQYGDVDKSMRQIGRELNVAYVLEGTVRWEHSAQGSSRVLVTPQLIRVADDTHLWSAQYEREMKRSSRCSPRSRPRSSSN